MREKIDRRAKKGKRITEGIADLSFASGSSYSSPPRPPRFLTLLRFNLCNLLRPRSLLLLALAALSSYYAVYVSFYPLFLMGTQMVWSDVIRFLLASNNMAQFHPLRLMISYHDIPWPIGGFSAFMFVGGAALLYVVASNLVAEDSGCLPRNLLYSRPVSKTSFLLSGFLVRFLTFTVLGFAVPFIIAYAQNVAEIGAAAQPTITNYATMSQWYSLAFNGLFWQYLAIFVAYIFTLTSLTLLISVVTRRGIFSLLLVILLSFVSGYAAWYITDDYVTTGTSLGGIPSLPAFVVLIPAFYLAAAIDNVPTLEWRIQSPIFGFPTAIALLALYGAVLVALSVIVHSRGGAE